MTLRQSILYTVLVLMVSLFFILKFFRCAFDISPQNIA